MTAGKQMQFAQYEEKIKGQPSICLRFTIQDAKEAIAAMPDGRIFMGCERNRYE